MDDLNIGVHPLQIKAICGVYLIYIEATFVVAPR